MWAAKQEVSAGRTNTKEGVVISKGWGRMGIAGAHIYNVYFT